MLPIQKRQKMCLAMHFIKESLPCPLGNVTKLLALSFEVKV